MWGIDTSSETAHNCRFQQRKKKKHYTAVNPFKKTEKYLITPIVNIEKEDEMV